MLPNIDELLIEEPMIVGTHADVVILVSRSDAMTLPISDGVNAQLYNQKDDAFSPVMLLGSFLKFMSFVEGVNPPQPFDREAMRRKGTRNSISIPDMLKEHTREEVRQILVEMGLANDVGHAEFVIAVSLGESKGDRIKLDRDENEN